MGFVNVGKITSVKLKETPKKGDKNMIIPLKILNQPRTLTSLSIMFLSGKCYVMPLKRMISVKIWKQYLWDY